MLLTVKEKKEETKDTFRLIFKKPVGFIFYPGQYLDMELPIKDLDKRGKVRAYTIASSPTEDFLMITTREGISDFKKHLQKIKAGDIVKVTHPAGTFTLDETEPAVMLTGGIGITPFRSMLKYAVDKKLTTPITLIYTNGNGDFVFKKELDLWQSQYPKLKIVYINTAKDGHLDKSRIKKLLPPYYILHTTYYLSGPPAMVDSFEKILLDLEVDEVNIRYDRFDGY